MTYVCGLTLAAGSAGSSGCLIVHVMSNAISAPLCILVCIIWAYNCTPLFWTPFGTQHPLLSGRVVHVYVHCWDSGPVLIREVFLFLR